MFNWIVNVFSGFPPELATVILAALPVGELRLSLPVAILGFKMSALSALGWSIFGNMIPVTIILLFADKFHAFLEKRSHLKFSQHWVKQLARAQESFKKYEKYGLIGLMIFIGVPLPMTGAWTGALAAFILGVPFRHSWPYVFGGVIISGVVTLLVTEGAIKIF